MDVLEVLGLLLVFGLIIGLAYLTTRIVGTKLSGRTKNKYMRIVETLPLGIDKALYLIGVDKKFFLFFSGKKGFELVSEIDIDDLVEDNVDEEQESAGFNFKKIFETYSGLSNKNNNDKTQNQGEDTQEVEEAGIEKSINRLKRINSNNR